ncbi:hypothetical protein GYB61_13015 [bacterium]|nr:hypothetical protein [bacterium]
MSKTDLATQLLDAHVAFTKQQLTGPGFEALVGRNLDATMADAEQLKLAEVVAAKDVKAVAHTYALDMVLGGAVPALVGDMLRKLFGHKINDKTRLIDLIPDETFDEWLDKLIELKEAREALIHVTVTSPVFAALISELLYAGARGYVTDSKVADRIPGARSALKIGAKMASRAKPDLADAVDSKLRAYAKANTQSSLAASEDFLRGMLASPAFRDGLHDMWDEYKTTPLGEMRAYLADDDLEDLFVIGYEHWQHLRETKWLRALIDAGIDQFFASFKKHSLRELLDAIGVTPDHIRADVQRFLPPVIASLDNKGLLDELIRRNLAPFYESDAAKALLGKS